MEKFVINNEKSVMIRQGGLMRCCIVEREGILDSRMDF